ncbi:hypothetical protein F0U44_19385 [Nocardioides humilatus]|uniref:Calcium-binding protein n=1 Tax=Nocardioides humilatus TaxID=2607660 RepID=A0A5B1L541_9ACTN|nr:hypothetical protein [Nocardioides humilatus]KAA1415811.1 hypothetical protein F0U44_19385 [Nocardioides humilatus]
MLPRRIPLVIVSTLAVASATLTTSGSAPATAGGPTCFGAGITVNLGLGQHPTGQRDVILGTAGDDVIFAFRGDDLICGMGGHDTIQGGGGDDMIDGGTGADQVSYGTSPKAVTVSLAISGPQLTGGATGNDTLVGFEDLSGSPYDDTLTGDSNGNYIRARRGDDTVDGAAGQDTITASLGTDTCDGGPDADWARGCEVLTNVP